MIVPVRPFPAYNEMSDELIISVRLEARQS